MDKLEANKIIHEQIMGKCAHEWHCAYKKGFEKPEYKHRCEKCDEDKTTTWPVYETPIPNYCNDANEAVKALYELPLTDFYFQAAFWNAEYRDEDNSIQLVSNTDINLAICTAALGTIGITEEIE